MNTRLLGRFCIIIITCRCEGAIVATTMVSNSVSYKGKTVTVDVTNAQGCAARCLVEEACGAVVYDSTAAQMRCSLFLDIYGPAELLPGQLVYRRSLLKNGNQIVKLPLPAVNYYQDHVAKCASLGLTVMPAPTNKLDRTTISCVGTVVMDVMTPANSLDIVNAAGQNVSNPYLRFFKFPTSPGQRYCFVNNYMNMFYILCSDYGTTASSTVCITP